MTVACGCATALGNLAFPGDGPRLGTSRPFPHILVVISPPQGGCIAMRLLSLLAQVPPLPQLQCPPRGPRAAAARGSSFASCHVVNNMIFVARDCDSDSRPGAPVLDSHLGLRDLIFPLLRNMHLEFLLDVARAVLVPRSAAARLGAVTHVAAVVEIFAAAVVVT